jgi:HEPN domain-containing protein
MRPPEEVRKELVCQWLLKADEDMRASETLASVEPPFPYPACFHAQQAAEKYLKALLTWRQIEFPKTHDIEELLRLIESAHPRVASALAESDQLTPYGVEIRYPGDAPQPDLDEAARAIELAHSVRDTVMAQLAGVR